MHFVLIFMPFFIYLKKKKIRSSYVFGIHYKLDMRMNIYHSL